MAVDTSRIRRYRTQSLRLLDIAESQLRGGRWARSEDLLWGSLTLAVKAVALGQGLNLEGDQAVRDYATQLGKDRRDRRIRDAFGRLASFGESAQRVLESRSRVDHLFPVFDDLTSAIKRLWEMAPPDDEA